MKKWMLLLAALVLCTVTAVSAFADGSTWVCPQCGAVHPFSEKFCSACGTAQPVGTQFCPKCGRAFREGELYCPVDATPRYGNPGSNSGIGGQGSGMGGQGSGIGGQSSGMGGQSSGMGGQSSGIGGQGTGSGSSGWTGIPVLSQQYPGFTVKMTLLEGAEKEGRRQSYAGPGKAYAGSGGYKPYKQSGITAYFIESKWVFVHLSYWTVEDRFLYLPSYAFTSLKNVPTVDSLSSRSGRTLERIVPSWGPGSQYYTFEKFAAPSGAGLKIFFQENGYYYAEYTCAEGLVRMWLPAGKVAVQ